MAPADPWCLLMPSLRPLQDNPGATGETKFGHFAPKQARVAAFFGLATFKMGLVGFRMPVRGGLLQSGAPPARNTGGSSCALH